jgi:hypothetical protein
MKKQKDETRSDKDQRLVNVLEGLVSPDPELRDGSLDQLIKIDGYAKSPLVASVLVSRISEPDVEIRLHVIQLLGSLLDFDSAEGQFAEKAMVFAQNSLDQMGEEQLIKLLEVSEKYLAAEAQIKAILKMISYAGKGLGGIVNDRKQPVSLRQQAVFYCGEVGYLSSRPALQVLVQRVEKDRIRAGDSSQRKKSQDEELIYPYAITALEKLKI